MERRFPDLLRNGVWHTTHPDRYKSILRSGSIQPNPPLSDSERWKSECGPDYYPFVRRIGGVSLFHFDNFDEVAYGEDCPMSSWWVFIPVRREWPAAVWLKMHFDSIRSSYQTPEMLARRQAKENARRHTLMPRIEGAVIGSIPVASIEAAYLVKSGSSEFERVGIGGEAST